MKAVDFALLVNARRVARSRFLARCPAHDDRFPSLSIAEGQDGRILLKCFAGCSTDSILAAVHLSRRDLFHGPPPSPVQLAALEAKRKAAEQQNRAKRAIEREAWDRARRWAAVADALGAKLARTPDGVPDGNALTRTFHDACEQLHEAEIAALTVSGIREAA
jgi:hypothetical protein